MIIANTITPIIPRTSPHTPLLSPFDHPIAPRIMAANANMGKMVNIPIIPTIILAPYLSFRMVSSSSLLYVQALQFSFHG